MANTKISDLSILGKSSFVSDDYILVARGTTSNAKVQATSLLPTLTNLGNGSNYLLNPITSQNVFSQKQLLVSGGILALANNTNEDGDLLELEKEAYLNGNIIFRNWEDSIKNTKIKNRKRI